MKAKELLIMASVTVGIVLGFGVVGYYETHYSIDAEVIENSKGIITFEDKRGEIWEYQTTADFNVGDNVKLYMDTNGTNNTYYDDIIVNFK